MRRGHDARDYIRRVEAIKNSRRKLALTSDIIVGFPGESEFDFRETLRMVERCEYEGLYLFKYSKRPGTPAANLPDDVPAAVKTERFLELQQIQRQIQERVYSQYVGRTVQVLVEGESARSDKDVTGHTTCHKV